MHTVKGSSAMMGFENLQKLAHTSKDSFNLLRSKNARRFSILSSNSGKQSLISVNLQKLDQLHDIVGEIITTESMVISNPELEGLKLESFLSGFP